MFWRRWTTRRVRGERVYVANACEVSYLRAAPDTLCLFFYGRGGAKSGARMVFGIDREAAEKLAADVIDACRESRE